MAEKALPVKRHYPPELPPGFKDAGQEYYDGLRHLGFYPEALTWAYEPSTDRHVLAMIWSGIDKFGPQAIANLLFKAYKASILTRKIDPFQVYVVSERQYLSQVIAVDHAAYPERMWKLSDDDTEEDVIFVAGSWSYKSYARQAPTTMKRHWKKFERAVDQAA